jgi:putative ABC transport system permease protein
MSRRSRFRNLIGLEPQADVDDEFAFHLEMRTQELIDRGIDPAEARARAGRRFGDYASPRHACVAIGERRKSRMARTEYLADLRQDLGYTLRLLRRAPWFALMAMGTLALGIGASVAVFSVANAVLLKPLAVADADHLVLFETRTGPRLDPGASPVMLIHWRTLGDVMEQVAAFAPAFFNDTSGAAPVTLHGRRVSREFFGVFGLEVRLGRTFSDDEDRPGGAAVVMVSETLWMRRFSANPDVIGQVLSLDGVPHTIIGVLGPAARLDDFGAAVDIWAPLQLDPESRTEGHSFSVVAQLRNGVRLEHARARLRDSTNTFRQAFPHALPPDAQFDLVTIGDALVGPARPLLFVLLGAVACVLIIACANVAALLLLRASARSREMAIRSAIGAGRWRIVRQLLTESLVLSSGASAIGVASAVAGVRTLVATDIVGLPRISSVSAIDLDWRVLAFTVTLTIITGVLCGLAPIRQISRRALGPATRAGGIFAGSEARAGRTQSSLVVAQVALALVLLTGAALFMRTLVALSHVDPGFDAEHVLTLRTPLGAPGLGTATAIDALIRRGKAALQELPVVTVTGSACGLPLEDGFGLPFVIVGRPLAADQRWHGGAGWLAVSSGYFETLKIPLRRGRTFSDDDGPRHPAVAIINDAMARQYWPDRDPIGQRLILGHGIGREFQDEPVREIVGVVGNVHASSLSTTPGTEVYVPQSQFSDVTTSFMSRGVPMAWVVRTTVASEPLALSLQSTLEHATGLTVSTVRTMDEIVQRSLARPRLSMRLMTIFGAIALLLAAAGLYALIAWLVAQRTAEIGLRMALGATTTDVARMMVWHGVRLALIGIVAGAIGAGLLTRALAQGLLARGAWDPAAFIAALLLVLVVAMLATWIPATRASRVDPLIALRRD